MHPPRGGGLPTCSAVAPYALPYSPHATSSKNRNGTRTGGD